MRTRRIFRAAVALSLLVGCGDDEGGGAGVVRPGRADFEAVADVMLASCGSLDCHGQPGRNLSIWGLTGRRFAPGDVTGMGSTAADEYDATYRSVVGLEPETLARVVADGGAEPERLLLIRKPRGGDSHRGKTVMEPDDLRDRCLRSWLAGAVDRVVCGEALKAPPLPAD